MPYHLTASRWLRWRIPWRPGPSTFKAKPRLTAKRSRREDEMPLARLSSGGNSSQGKHWLRKVPFSDADHGDLHARGPH